MHWVHSFQLYSLLIVRISRISLVCFQFLDPSPFLLEAITQFIATLVVVLVPMSINKVIHFITTLLI